MNEKRQKKAAMIMRNVLQQMDRNGYVFINITDHNGKTYRVDITGVGYDYQVLDAPTLIGERTA